MGCAAMSRYERCQRITAYGMCSVAAVRFMTLGCSHWVTLLCAVPVFALWIGSYIAVNREGAR